MEQTLIEDLVIESIRIYGVDVWYLPRTLVAKDDLLNEDDLSSFNDEYLVEMYVKSVDGFEGKGDFLSKFGLQIRDSVTMTMAQRVYDIEIGLNTQINRPREGDLIYLPLNKKFFEIQHVEHEAIFYQMGSLQKYDLRAELFEYSGERFFTGQDELDNHFESIDAWQDSTDIKYMVEVRNGVFNLREESEGNGWDVQPILEMYAGQNYLFDLSHASNTNNRMKFYTTNSPSTGIPITTQTGIVVETGVAGTAGASVKISIPRAATVGNTFHYISTATLGMGSTIKTLDSKLNVEAYDALADNKIIETIADNIIDFSQKNPFGEENY